MEETLLETIYSNFFERGILGVLVVVNMMIILYLYRRVEALRDHIQSLLREHSLNVHKLQEEKLQMQEEHLDTLLQVRDEVTEVTTRLVITMETLVSTLAGKNNE